MIHFLHPHVLFLLVPIALVAFWLARRGRPVAVAYSSTDIVRSIAKVRRTRWGRIVPALRWLGASLLVVALARPVVEHHHSSIHASGVDVVLAVDVSGSMQARDMAGADTQAPVTRLSAAKDVVSRFVHDRVNDRIGVVGFAGEPYIASPLTLDHDWVETSVDGLAASTQSGLRDGTAIGSAIAAGVRRLDTDAKSKIMVLLTDGQNNAGKIAPAAAAQAAKALGVKIYTVAVGSKGEALVPVTNDRGREELVMTKVDVDEPALAQVAETTGGKFYRATDTTSLHRVYDEIDRLEKTTRTVSSFTEKSERFAWFAVPGLVLLAGSLALSATRFRRVPC